MNATRWRVVTAVLFILLLIKGALEVWIQTETLERAGDLLLMAALVYIAYRPGGLRQRIRESPDQPTDRDYRPWRRALPWCCLVERARGAQAPERD